MGLGSFFAAIKNYGLLKLYFQRISFQIIQRSKQLSLCSVAALKCLPVHRYSVVIYTFSGPLGL